MINILKLNYYGENQKLIEPKEFFSKTKKVILNIKRIMIDNCFCDLVSQTTGEAFRGLLESNKEELDSEDEYIVILKNEDGYLLRQEIKDNIEDEIVINEWEVIL